MWPCRETEARVLWLRKAMSATQTGTRSSRKSGRTFLARNTGSVGLLRSQTWRSASWPAVATRFRSKRHWRRRHRRRPTFRLSACFMRASSVRCCSCSAASLRFSLPMCATSTSIGLNSIGVGSRHSFTVKKISWVNWIQSTHQVNMLTVPAEKNSY